MMNKSLIKFAAVTSVITYLIGIFAGYFIGRSVEKREQEQNNFLLQQEVHKIG